jgi:excisionase family DNA binding protein
VPLIDAKTLAAELQLTPKFVRRLAQRGKIPAERYGSEWRFDVEQVRKASQYVDPIAASAHKAARQIWLKPKRRVV